MLNVLTGNNLRFFGLSSFVPLPAKPAKARQVVSEWQRYANVTFNYAGGADSTPNIQISPGSWSFVGKNVQSIAMDKATMNLD
jgi:hypothetical protein